MHHHQTNMSKSNSNLNQCGVIIREKLMATHLLIDGSISDAVFVFHVHKLHGKTLIVRTAIVNASKVDGEEARLLHQELQGKPRWSEDRTSAIEVQNHIKGALKSEFKNKKCKYNFCSNRDGNQSYWVAIEEILVILIFMEELLVARMKHRLKVEKELRKQISKTREFEMQLRLGEWWGIWREWRRKSQRPDRRH